MLNREETKALNAAIADMRSLSDRAVKESAERIDFEIGEIHFKMAAMFNMSKMMNGEERRVLREANQALYLAREDINKHKDPASAAARIMNAVTLASTVAAGEVKAKR